MTAEGPGRRELTELVTNHIFRHKDGQEGVSVVDQERHPHELRGHRRTPRPRLDRLAVIRLLRFLDLDQEVLVNKRSLFN